MNCSVVSSKYSKETLILLAALHAIPDKVEDEWNGLSEPAMGVNDYTDYLVERSHSDPEAVVAAAVLLRRLYAKHPALTAGAGSKPRLVLGALLVAHKMTYDEVYTNKSWARISGHLVTLPELNAMEREFLRLLNYDVLISEAVLEAEVVAYDATVCTPANAAATAAVFTVADSISDCLAFDAAAPATYCAVDTTMTDASQQQQPIVEPAAVEAALASVLESAAVVGAFETGYVAPVVVPTTLVVNV